MDNSIKVRENKVRRMAERQGVRLVKSRTRDPHALDYGRCYLVDRLTKAIVMGNSGHMTIDDVERILQEGLLWQAPEIRMRPPASTDGARRPMAS